MHGMSFVLISLLCFTVYVMFPLLILLGIGTSLTESHGYVRRVGHCVNWSLGC